MLELAPQFLAELARQLGFLSVFLGGFSATLLVELVVAAPRRRSATFAIVASAVAAVSFIVSAGACTMLTVALDPSAPASVARQSSIGVARSVSALGFLVGLYALLGSLGSCGFIRSKRARAAEAFSIDERRAACAS